MEEERFSRRAVEELTYQERQARLREMESELAKRIGDVLDPKEFFRRTTELIQELRSIGHELWSFDSDGETFETWAGDYTRPDLAGHLAVTFKYPANVSIKWKQ